MSIFVPSSTINRKGFFVRSRGQIFQVQATRVFLNVPPPVGELYRVGLFANVKFRIDVSNVGLRRVSRYEKLL
jgi:hypothetical protein